MGRGIEIIARGVCVRHGRILLCRSRGAANTFLPGGHVEFGESAADALRREIREEMGVDCRVGRFLAAVEHTFIQRGRRHCELNLVFGFKAPRLRADRAPDSLEPKLQFLWAPIRDIGQARLEPAAMRRSLAVWVSRRPGAPCWASTYPGEPIPVATDSGLR